jgi:hypothetical protein
MVLQVAQQREVKRQGPRAAQIKVECNTMLEQLDHYLDHIALPPLRQQLVICC